MRGSRKRCLPPLLYPGRWGRPLPPGNLSSPSTLPVLSLLDSLGRGDSDKALGGNSTARFSQLFKSFEGQLNFGSCQSSVWSWVSVPAMQAAASSYRLGQGLLGAQHTSV